jgi:hypothetical protein
MILLSAKQILLDSPFKNNFAAGLSLNGFETNQLIFAMLCVINVQKATVNEIL